MKCLIMLTKNWTDMQSLKDAEDVCAWMDNYIGNTGNLMFMNAARFLATLPGNTCDFYNWYKMHENPDQYKEEINEEYDCVLYPMANVLQSNTQYLEDILTRIRGIHIPVFILGIGITLEENDTIEHLAGQIRQPASELIHIVEKSGGAIACRGYLTKELFDRLGAKDIVFATGCPSLYQNGILHISNEKKEQADFHPGLNGRVQDFQEAVFQNSFTRFGADYICQDQYSRALYQPKLSFTELLEKYGYTGVKLLMQKKVHYFADLTEWYTYIHNNIDFMFGTRIHGNLIALLAGKPACVFLRNGHTDLRVKELADFYAVPTVQKLTGKQNLYDIYMDMDYTKFNERFVQNFENFRTFCVSHSICQDIPRTPNPVFMEDRHVTRPPMTNYEYLQEEYAHMNKVKKWLYERGIKH